MRVALAALLFAAAPAYAEDRPVHGSAGAGTSIALTGGQGDRLRFDVAFDLKPRHRYGVIVGWRQFDADHRGLLVAGIVYEAAASRPRLVIDLHASAGVDLANPAPLVAGGIRPTLAIIGPLAIVFDVSAYVILDGIESSRLQLASSTLFAIKW